MPARQSTGDENPIIRLRTAHAWLFVEGSARDGADFKVFQGQSMFATSSKLNESNGILNDLFLFLNKLSGLLFCGTEGLKSPENSEKRECHYSVVNWC